MMAEPTYHYPIQRKPMPNLHPHTTGRPAPDSSFAPTYSHSRTRTSSSSNRLSSNLSPYPSKPSYSQQQQQPQHPQHPQQQSQQQSRRTPSTHTFSSFTPSTGAGGSPTINVARTPSSSSNRPFPQQQNQGYVALLRKQKATVWCDRAQHLDPRHLAAQRAAKARAHLEVAGAPDSGRSLTTTSTAQSGLASGGSRVAAKIRHHGKAGLVGYAPAGDFGVGVGGVPMRLSATEVEGEDSDGDDVPAGSVHNHRRTGSGRSSLGSSRRGTGLRQSGSGSGARWSGGPPSASATPRDSQGEFDVVVVPPGGAAGGHKAGSMASGSSAERNDAVAELDAARVASNSLLRQVGGAGGGKVTREKSVRNPEELRRRGSVDERTMTMSAQRLFVANPDEDSD
ncbi:hypothetical protein VE03_02201 [Pseudogymnoascus sp. 23342-1-I1]|nr:hypothetical protein VE03_02201 [Pseudogymnoascus sp. 23342-1-I1]